MEFPEPVTRKPDRAILNGTGPDCVMLFGVFYCLAGWRFLTISLWIGK